MTPDEFMKLAQRIAKHDAPVQADSAASRRIWMRLAAQKLAEANLQPEPDFWILDIGDCAMLRAMGVKPDF